jgi:hypothetical protein
MQKFSDLFSITLDIYKIDILVAINYSDRKLLKAFDPNMKKEEFDEHYDGFKEPTVRARWCVSNGGWHVLRFKEVPSPGELAHECFHAVSYILRNISINLNDTSEEAYAYLLEYLIEKITGVIKKSIKSQLCVNKK